MEVHHFKSKSRWYNAVYILLILLITASIIFMTLHRSVIWICILLIGAPFLLIPYALSSEYITRNGKIIFVEKSTHYDLQGNREPDHKSIFIDVKDIKKIEKVNSWWSNEHIRIWVNDYKTDSHTISIEDVDRFIKVIQSINPNIVIAS